MKVPDGMSAFTVCPKNLRTSLCGKRKLEIYERLARYYKKKDLIDMCDAFQINYNPTANKIDLAMLIVKNRPNIEF